MENPTTKKTMKHIHLGVALAALLLLYSGMDQSRAAPQTADVLQITSDRLEARQQEQQVVFSGNVVATHGDLTVKGDRVTIFYLEGDASEPNGEDALGRIDRVVVQGNVRITQENSMATGEKAVYYRLDNKVVLSGNARVQRDKDVIQGSFITHFLDSGKSIVEGGPSGPVEATIFTSGSADSFFMNTGKTAGSSATDGEKDG